MNPKSRRFPDRLKKLHRLLSILRMFDNRKQCTAETLAARFNTTKRNIFRDINDLSSSGFAIAFDKEQNTYTFADPDFTLRDLDLTDNELMALLLGKQISHSIGRPFENAFTSLLKKARKDTGDKTKGRIKRLEEKQKFWVDIDPMDGFENIEEQYNAITEAMDKNQEIEIVLILILFNMGTLVGESEHNTRKIFDKYKGISKGKKNSPVLLLNEADQFLHKRINVTRATDHMYNQMQNIFLEQLEKFEGILIATTNLIENLDSAFSRRFQHKIEFRRLGPVERLKLYQIHIPEKAPLSGDVNLQHLAEHYDLSGGQIAVVVQNAATRAAKRGDGAISMADFIMACNEELQGNFDERARSKVGF